MPIPYVFIEIYFNLCLQESLAKKYVENPLPVKNDKDIKWFTN